MTSTGDDWEVISAIVPLEMGVKIRTADNGTAQMTFEDGSALLMGGNSVINVRSFDYDEEAGARVLTVDVISGSIAYDIFSEGLTASLAKLLPQQLSSQFMVQKVFLNTTSQPSQLKAQFLRVVKKMMMLYLVSFFLTKQEIPYL